MLWLFLQTGHRHFDLLCFLCIMKVIMKRKRLFAGTLPANKNLFAGTLPANKNLFAGTLPANKNLFAGTLRATMNSFTRTLPSKRSLFATAQKINYNWSLYLLSVLSYYTNWLNILTKQTDYWLCLYWLYLLNALTDYTCWLFSLTMSY